MGLSKYDALSKRIEQLCARKKAAIDKKYPVTEATYTQWIREGKGKLLPENAIRELAVARDGYGNVTAYKLFDFGKEAATLKRANDINIAKREEACAELNEMKDSLLDEALIGDDTYLKYKLEAIIKKEF